MEYIEKLEMKNLMKVQFILLILIVSLSGCTAIKAIKLVNGGKVVSNNFTESVVPFTLEGHPILIKARMNNSQKE